MRFSLAAVLGLALWIPLAGCLSGCAGYRLGPVNGEIAGARSVQVHPFSNQTFEPRSAGEYVTSQLRKQVQKDGTYQLMTHSSGAADIDVNGVLTHFNRHELSFEQGDVLTVRDYRLSLTAQVSARERGTGKVIFDRAVTGYTIVRMGSDLTNVERQALPLLAEDLAKNISTLLTEGSW
jgi:hypothetical protein